jgi:hypothetical protein
MTKSPTKSRLQHRLIEERDGIAFWLTEGGSHAIFKDDKFVQVFTGRNSADAAWDLWDRLRAERNTKP